MVLADEYTFGNFLLGVIWIFAWVIAFWLIVTVFVDVFRRRDISGWMKAFWVVFVFIFPWLGALIYIVTQHDGMAERSMSEARVAREQMRAELGVSVADELEKLEGLKNQGKLTDEEYQRMRARIVG